MQYPSLFSYCETYNFLALYKKSKEASALTEAIQSGEVSVSKLRHIWVVINQENQRLWIEKAKSETNKKLINETAKVSHYTKKREALATSYIGVDHMQ